MGSDVQHPMHHLFEAARDAMAKSHSPYSQFPVGAALLTAEGAIHTGANMEVISYPEGWCAETSALAHYVMAGGGTITDVAVIAENKARVTPCGGCRQRLAEFAGPDTRLHLCDKTGIVETVFLKDLFPMGFEAEVLR